jgi:hypothetical protein
MLLPDIINPYPNPGFQGSESGKKVHSSGSGALSRPCRKTGEQLFCTVETIPLIRSGNAETAETAIHFSMLPVPDLKMEECSLIGS